MTQAQSAYLSDLLDLSSTRATPHLREILVELKRGYDLWQEVSALIPSRDSVIEGGY